LEVAVACAPRVLRGRASRDQTGDGIGFTGHRSLSGLHDVAVTCAPGGAGQNDTATTINTSTRFRAGGDIVGAGDERQARAGDEHLARRRRTSGA